MNADALSRLAWVESELARHCNAILATANQCPPGGNRAWDQILAFYHVRPLPPADRVSEVVGRKMSHGAVPTEVRCALESLAAWAHNDLQALAPQLANHERFLFVQHQIAHLSVQADEYESSVTPSQVPSVGSIFANAAATAGKAPWNAVKVPASLVFVCESCGAPQQTPLHFTCKYCGNPMAGRA
jgi:hypothetical protein